MALYQVVCCLRYRIAWRLIDKGVSRVHIMDGRIPHSLLLEIFTNKGIGTAIIKDNEEKYWNEQQ